MKRRFLPPVALLLLAALFLAWWLRPANVLKRRVAGLLETAEVPSTMTDIGRGARGPNLAKFLDRSISIRRPAAFPDDLPESLKRDNAASLYSAAARYCTRIEFEEPDFEEVAIDGDQASVRFRVDAVAQFPRHCPADGIQVVDTTWRKVEGEWLLGSIAWEEEGRP